MRNKKTILIVILVISCLFTLVAVRDLIIKTALAGTVSGITGARVSIAGFSLSVLRSSVRLSGFKMYNPQGFERGILADLPRINVDYDLFPLFKGKLHLRMVDIELKELGLEKNQEGKLNVDSLKVVKERAGHKSGSQEKPSKPVAMEIDRLNLSMARIVFKDYSSGGEPSVQVYDINLKKSYKDIKSAQQLAALILSEPMKHAGIKGAEIYGLAALTGVGFIPIALAATFGGKGSVEQDFETDTGRLYDVSLEVLKRIGRVSKEDKPAGLIEAQVNKADITVRLKQVSGSASRITVSARKQFLPKREIAGGVLLQISEQLKK